MAESQSPNWGGLKEKYTTRLTESLQGHFARGPFRITAHQLAIEANATHDESSQLLRELTEAGALNIAVEYTCPCERSESLTSEQSNEDVCVHCNQAFGVDVSGKPLQITRFVHEAPETRDVRWMLALHGMNTTGAWQETFNWLVSRSYRCSVPVAIYKYGIVRPGAILKFRQRSLIRDLNTRIRRLSGDSEKTGFGGVPDVIAHSLGTWLLGHALIEDPTLQVGRIILTGSILRPDFDWAPLLKRKQVEAVLCHLATNDFWAGIAHYIIPDSGPSGRRGFNDGVMVTHVVLERGRHSDFFKDAQMQHLFQDVWQDFLTKSIKRLNTNSQETAIPSSTWKEAWWPFRATLLRFILLALLSLIGLIVFASCLVGIIRLWQLV